MNDHDPLPKSTVDLLRDPLPETTPRPGFETRLLNNLRETKPKPNFGLRYALAGLATILIVAAIIATNLNPGTNTNTPVANTPDQPLQTNQPVLELNELPNPLSTEAEALKDTATRTGEFLISLLPSLPDSNQSL